MNVFGPLFVIGSVAVVVVVVVESDHSNRSCGASGFPSVYFVPCVSTARNPCDGNQQVRWFHVVTQKTHRQLGKR